MFKCNCYVKNFERVCVCVCVCVFACVCVCVCVCVVSVIVKRPVLPPSVVDGRSRNPLYYYYCYYYYYYYSCSGKLVLM